MGRRLWQQRHRARDILSREAGYVRKPHTDRLRIALAFPNTYFVGMSSLGFQTVYRLFNACDNVVCERVFLPPKQELAARLAASEPLVTLESGTPVAELDVVAFSVSFEWDYANVLTLLRLARIPARAAERSDDHPLVVVGGAVTFLNPEPLAPFADVIAVGEGEVLVPAFVNAATGASDRKDALSRLARLNGFYVPSFYDVRYRDDGCIDRFEPQSETGAVFPVCKVRVGAVDRVDPPHSTIFTPDTEFGCRFLVEVVRGCARLCRFCWAGYNYLPVRAFPVDRILKLAQAARKHTNRIGLMSIALCDHPDIDEILRRLVAMGYRISPASLRLDDLTDSILGLLRQSGERTIAIAPESGSDRLRRVINKAVTNEEILARAELVFASGIENLKLYFMIGLPTETDEDLTAIRDLTLRIRGVMLKHARPRGHVGRIIGSVNPLVPKPGTAYQWLPMEDPVLTERKARRLRKMLAGVDNVRLNIKSERTSKYQALLSLGDRRVADVIEAAERNGGGWCEAVASAGLDVGFYVFRDRTGDRVLPWDIIDAGTRASFFRAEFDKGLRGEWTQPQRRQQQDIRPAAVLT